MKSFITKNKKIIELFIALIFIVIYFSISVFIFWDSAHYMSYVNIFEGSIDWSNWDIVRGPIFPLIICLGNIIFGKSAQGLLIMTFMFYIFMVLCVYLILKKAFPTSDNIKNDKIVKYGTLLFILIDPIILGYYHALLTEFVAITLSLYMCLMSFVWLEYDIRKDTKKSIFLSILFCILTPIAWFLKQPYVTVVIFPIIIATIISVLKSRILSNIIYRVSTVASCLVCLFICMVAWNNFLESKNIDLNSDRNIVSNFGSQLIEALNNYQVIDLTGLSIDDINNSQYFTDGEKTYLTKNIDNNDFKIINVKALDGNIIDQQIIYLKDHKVSTLSAFKFILKNLFVHPFLTIESYTSNYLAIANIYPKTTTDGVGYKVEKNLSYDYCHENCSVAGMYTLSRSSVLYMTDEMYSRVSSYYTTNNPSYPFKLIYRCMSKLYVNFYKILILLLPVAFVISLILRILKTKNKSMDMCLILLGYSLFHILVHVATGACIDRYASPAYITTFIGFILMVYNIRLSLYKKKI